MTEARPFPDTPKILASRSALPPKSRKIIKNKSQGATPGHRTLQSPNFARCDTATSHPATLSHHTLRHRAIAPCHFRLSHPATQKARFLPLKSPFSPCASPRHLSAHALNHLPSALASPSKFTVKVSTKFHDRFLIIDKSTLIHVGASLNHLGKKCFAFSSLDKSNIPDILISEHVPIKIRPTGEAAPCRRSRMF